MAATEGDRAPRRLHVKTTRRALLAAGALVVVSACLLGCETHQPYSDNGAPKIGIVGDSLTVISAFDGTVDATFHPAYDTDVEAKFGQTAEDPATATWLHTAAAPGPRAVVIELGTNDARREEISIATVEATLASLDDQARASEPGYVGTDCVVYMTVDTTNPSWGPDRAAAINTWVRQQPHYYDWDETVRTWQGDPLFDRPDDPHGTVLAFQTMMNGLRAAIDACPPERTR